MNTLVNTSVNRLARLIPAALLVIPAALAPALTPSARAQTPPVPARVRPGGPLARLAAFLGLSDAQKAQLRPLLKAQARQVRAVRADTTLALAAKRARIRTIRRTARAQMMAVLTPGQRARLTALKGRIPA